MSWKLDAILFSDYYVRVSKSSGVIDMPEIHDHSHDWLDLDGKDYWEPLSEIKYKDREIVLNCWIKATSYAQFKTRLTAFYNALKSPDKRILTPPYGDPVECYLDKQILLERKARYVQSLQVGVFVLRLTVPGDPDFLPITIKRWTGTETLEIATVYTNNLKVNKTLQGDIFATLSFESATKLDLKYFDYIQVNSNGNNNDNFHLATDPNYRKQSTNKYTYDLRMEHQGTWLGDSQFLNLNSEADFYVHANMEEIVDMIVDNHNRSWWNNFQKGTIAATERRLHKFTGEDCLSVLRRLCAEYELEYEFEYVVSGTYRINVKEKVATDRAVTLEYGKGKGLYELSREPIDKNELCTILYAFGSNKNLKPGYRGGIGRLSFTGNPLIANEGLHDGAGPHERTVFFDDIFPQRTAKVTAYQQVLPENLTEAQKYANPQGIFKLVDTTLDFDLNDYLLGGLTAKVRMKTGDLAGFEFEILRVDYDPPNGIFDIYLIPFKDERGEYFPNATLTLSGESAPGAADGDEYTLVDVDQPASYVAAAEAELEAAATAYLANHSTPNFPYRCVVDPAFMDANPGGFEVGDRVTVIDTDYGINGLYRISNLTYDAYRQTYEFVLSDMARLTRRQMMEMRLEALERAQEATRSDEPESQRNDVESSGELRRRLLDPTDDKLNADRNIRNESIDPRMLAYDAGTLQWSIKGAWFYDKNNDGAEIAWTAGTFVIHNWAENTLDRYSIDKLRALGQEYNPTRTWTIDAGSWIVPALDYDTYWVYAKLNLTALSTECVIEFYKEHKEPKWVPGYVRYKIGEFQREIV
jgi:hypothetical protein